MLLEHSVDAIAGQHFRVTIANFTGTARLQVFIGGKRVTQKECPDPPCHEIIVLSKDTKGAILIVRVTTTAGENEEREFLITGGGKAYLEAGA